MTSVAQVTSAPARVVVTCDQLGFWERGTVLDVAAIEAANGDVAALRRNGLIADLPPAPAARRKAA